MRNACPQTAYAEAIAVAQALPQRLGGRNEDGFEFFCVLCEHSSASSAVKKSGHELGSLRCDLI